MSTRADAAQVRRWQDDVARDPGSPAFLPLADVYRREGRLEVARRLCIRGLARQPEHVEAHVLLGRVYREMGELEKALDEWDIALRLDPEHQPARRALGYLCLERRDWRGAVRHLEAALAAEPDDERLARATALARRHRDSEPGSVREPAVLLAEPLEQFTRDARCRLALVMESSGRVLARHGAAAELDLAAFASLGAGVQVASRALARMLGQPRFEQLCQGEGDRQLFLGTVSAPTGDLILLAVFGGDSNVGLVRISFDAFARVAAELPWWSAAPGAGQRADAFEADLASGLRAGQPAPAPHSLRP